MSAAKPALPPRSRGVQVAPSLPARPRIEAPTSGPTLPPKVISTKPILPAREPLHLNAPRLPVRAEVGSRRAVARTCGRTRPAKYEQRDYAIIDEYVRTLPEYRDMKELAHALVCNFEDEVDRLRAIFCWIAFNIAYDIVSFKSNAVPPQSARNTFEKRSAVCSGYSSLFQEFCQISGLKSIEINGMCRGAGFDASKVQIKKSTHAWNAVYVGQEWRMIDATWGAGHIDSTSFHFKFNDFYFLTDPDEFIYDHMPLDSNHLFTRLPVTWEQYVGFNTLKPAFWKNAVKLLNHIDQAGCLQAQHGEEIAVQLMIPSGSSIVSSIPPGMGHTVVTLTKSPVAGFVQADVKYRMSQPGSFEISTFLKSALTGTGDSHSQLLSFHVEVVPGTAFEQYRSVGYPQVFGHEIMGHCSIRSPLISPLPLKVTQEFILEDLSDSAANHTLDLYLWLDGTIGPQLRKSIKDDCVLYSTQHHVAKAGQVSLAQKKGSSYGFLCQWDSRT